MDWARENYDKPIFFQRDPIEVADFLIKTDPVLATYLETASNAPYSLEYFPELDTSRQTLGELAIETLVGFLPIIGDAADAMSALTGVSITGHKIDTSERWLAAIGAIIPFVPGSALRGGKKLPEVVTEVAAITGRHEDEIYAIFRVAGELSPRDAQDLDRIFRLINKREKLDYSDLQRFDDIAIKLRGPLEEARSLLDKPGKLPITKLRADLATGARFIPGTQEHKLQRWIEYQFRYGGETVRITDTLDPSWSRKYDTILDNWRAGNAFESGALTEMGLTKNNRLMMGPDGSGFIPDAVVGAPDTLEWGKAYDLIEIKNRATMAKTGNLDAMLRYVQKFGGHITIIFRGAGDGQEATKLTKPLSDFISFLGDKAEIVYR